MVFKKFVVVVAVFAIFVAGGLAAYQVADLGQKNAPAEPRNVTGEETVQEYDAWQYVDNATREFTAGFNDSVTVYNNTSHELTQGEDYEWNSTDGTIKFYDTASTQEGNLSTIDYTYYWNTQRVREVSGPISTVTEGVGRTAFLAGGFGLVVLLLVFGGIIASRLTKGMPESNR